MTRSAVCELAHRRGFYFPLRSALQLGPQIDRRTAMTVAKRRKPGMPPMCQRRKNGEERHSASRSGALLKASPACSGDEFVMEDGCFPQPHDFGRAAALLTA